MAGKAVSTLILVLKACLYFYCKYLLYKCIKIRYNSKIPTYANSNLSIFTAMIKNLGDSKSKKKIKFEFMYI